MAGNFTWVFLGLGAAISAAGVAIFGSLGLGNVPSTLATTLRSFIMAGMLLAVSLSTGQIQSLFRGDIVISGREWLFLTLAGASGAVSWLAYFAALRMGFATPVAALDRLSIAFVFILGMLVLGEQHTWKGWLGLFLLIGGIYLVAADKK
jgi:transporter family protein